MIGDERGGNNGMRTRDLKSSKNHWQPIHGEPLETQESILFKVNHKAKKKGGERNKRMKDKKGKDNLGAQQSRRI